LLRGRNRDVPFEDRDHTEAGYPRVVRVQEEGRIRLAPVVALLEIRPKCIHGLLPERTRAFLPPFAEDAHLAGRLEAYIVDVQSHRFGSACAGVVEQGEQGDVSTAETVRQGRRREQCLDLVRIEIRHDTRCGLLDGNVQDTTTDIGTPWVCVRDIREEAVDRDQSVVPSRHAVPSLDLEVVQEGKHGSGAEISQSQSNHLTTASPCTEAEEELDAVSVREYGVRTDVALSREVVLKEAAEQIRKRCLCAHDGPPEGRLSLAKAWKRVLASSSRAVVILR